MHFLDSGNRDHYAAQPTSHRRGQRTLREANGDVDYAIVAGRAFDALKHALGLMTGVLLLDLVGSERSVVDVPLGEKARAALDEAREEIASLDPRDPITAHHAHHLNRALLRVDEAAAWGTKQVDLVSGNHTDAYCDAIRDAWTELGLLARLMSGFSMVDLSQSCCAFHADLVAKLAKST